MEPSADKPQNKQTGNLEQLFRQKFEEAEVRPRASLWDQIDHDLLVQQNETYRQRLQLHRWAAAACLLLALGTGAWFTLHLNAPHQADLAVAGRPAPATAAGTAAGTGNASSATVGIPGVAGRQGTASAVVAAAGRQRAQTAGQASGSTPGNARPALGNGRRFTSVYAAEAVAGVAGSSQSAAAAAASYYPAATAGAKASSVLAAGSSSSSASMVASQPLAPVSAGNAVQGASNLQLPGSATSAQANTALAATDATTNGTANGTTNGTTNGTANDLNYGAAPTLTPAAAASAVALAPAQTTAAQSAAGTNSFAPGSTDTFAALMPVASALQPEAATGLPTALQPLPASQAWADELIREDEKKAVAATGWSFGGSHALAGFNPNMNFSQPAPVATVGRVSPAALVNRTMYQAGADEYRQNLQAGLAQRILLLARRRLSDRWSISTGVEVAQRQASSRTSYAALEPTVASTFTSGFVPTGRIRTQMATDLTVLDEAQKTNYRYRSAGVPVLVQYGQGNRNGWSLYARMGAVVNVLFNSRFSAENSGLVASRSYSLGATGSPYRKLLTSVRGGAGMQYRPAGASWALALGPTAEAGLNTFNADPVQSYWQQSRPYSVGLEATVEFGRTAPTVARH